MNKVQFDDQSNINFSQFEEQKPSGIYCWLLKLRFVNTERDAIRVILFAVLLMFIASIALFFIGRNDRKPSNTIEILPQESVGASQQ